MNSIKEYNLKHSTDRHHELNKYVPGGYTSAARKRKNSVMFERGRGGRLFDIDGNEYIDCTLALGPIIVGHNEPFIQEHIHRQIDKLLIGGAESPETPELAKKLADYIPCAEEVVFANTGSEAVHLALRIARASTGKQKIIRFEGHYHGWLDPMYTNGVAHGATAKNRPIAVAPNSPGQIDGSNEIFVVRWNDSEALDAVLSLYGSEVAAVIMEPVAFNAGGLVAHDGYLESVREQCSRHGALLIFDEVVSGFRLGMGGAQEKFGVIPDLAIFAKAAASGIPIALVAGTQKAMASLRDGRLSTLGTYTGNSLAIAASHATINFIASTPDFYERLENNSKYLADGMQRAIDETGAPIRLNRTGSIINPFWGAEGDLKTVASAVTADAARMHSIIDKMTLFGVYAMPRGAFFVCYRHSKEDLDKVIFAWHTAICESLKGVLKSEVHLPHRASDLDK